MRENIKNIIITVIVLAFINGIMIVKILKTPGDISKSERRKQQRIHHQKSCS